MALFLTKEKEVLHNFSQIDFSFRWRSSGLIFELKVPNQVYFILLNLSQNKFLVNAFQTSLWLLMKWQKCPLVFPFNVDNFQNGKGNIVIVFV